MDRLHMELVMMEKDIDPKDLERLLAASRTDPFLDFSSKKPAGAGAAVPEAPQQGKPPASGKGAGQRSDILPRDADEDDDHYRRRLAAHFNEKSRPAVPEEKSPEVSWQSRAAIAAARLLRKILSL